MKRTLLLYCSALLMAMPLALQAQVTFYSQPVASAMAVEPTASLKSEAIAVSAPAAMQFNAVNNVFLRHQAAAPAAAVQQSTASASSGRVYAADLFKAKNTQRSAGTIGTGSATDGSYRGIAAISAYQQIGIAASGGAGQIRRGGAPPPPPTPDIDDDDEGKKLPLGNALLPLSLLLLGYGVIKKRKQKRT